MKNQDKNTRTDCPQKNKMDYKPDTFLTDEKSARNTRTDHPQNEMEYKPDTFLTA
jgi:hypothetical protein